MARTLSEYKVRIAIGKAQQRQRAPALGTLGGGHGIETSTAKRENITCHYDMCSFWGEHSEEGTVEA